MYLFNENIFTNDLSPGVYSVYAFINDEEEVPTMYRVVDGLPTEDDVNNVYIGSFLIDSNRHVLEDFLFTIPDMAYTADRGNFYIDGGRVSGCNLRGAGNNTVNRDEGYYYDEGINCPMGELPVSYPVTTDNGSNYNIKHFNNVNPVATIYYMLPTTSTLSKPVVKTTGLIANKYYDRSRNELVDVPANHFTIQQHFITATGQDVILYGDTVYNSMTDAEAHLNDTFGNDLDFPRVEATRIIIGNYNNLDTLDDDMVMFYTMGRIAQVGTISPSFSDLEFKIYSGKSSAITPAAVHISLDELEDGGYDISDHGIYDLSVLPYNKTRQLFGLNYKYIKDDLIEPVIATQSDTRNSISGNGGYELADNNDLADLISRVTDIETEI